MEQGPAATLAGGEVALLGPCDSSAEWMQNMTCCVAPAATLTPGVLRPPQGGSLTLCLAESRIMAPVAQCKPTKGWCQLLLHPRRKVSASAYSGRQEVGCDLGS